MNPYYHHSLLVLLQGITEKFWEDNILKEIGKNNVGRSLLSQHPKSTPNIAGVHGAMYGTWWCHPFGGGTGTKSIVCTPPPLSAGGVEPLTKFSKKGDLTGS